MTLGKSKDLTKGGLINMTKFLCLLAMVFINSCISSNTQNAMAMKIELTIYPAGGGSKGYSIIIENNTINAMLRDIGARNDSIVVTGIKNKKTNTLSLAQRDSIFLLFKKINLDKEDITDVFMFDTWVYVVRINDKEMARFNSLTLKEKTTNEQNENLKELIRQMIILSPIEIDLQSFS